MTKNLLILQLFVSFLTSMLFVYMQGILAAVSALLGAIICIVPGLFFAIIFLRPGSEAKRTLHNFYWGALVKWALTLALFAWVLQWTSLYSLAMFIGFIAAQSTFWLVPLFIGTKPNNKTTM